MDKKYLPDLISELDQELLRPGYTKQLGMDFVREFFGITQDDFARTLSQAETQGLRVIRMAGDFQLHHAVLRRYLKHREILTASFFWKSGNGFRSIV